MNITSRAKDHVILVFSIALFVLVVLGVWLPRIGVPYEMDDTLAIEMAATRLLDDYQDPAQLAGISNPLGLIRDSLRGIWSDSGYRFGVYRPLDGLLTLKLIFWPYDPTIPTLFHAFILGATAALLFLLVVDLTGKKFVGLASAILYAFSIPSLQTTWLVIHSQPFINLFIVLGVMGYVRYVKYRQRGWLFALWVSAIVAPLFRELALILPATVLALMLVEKRREKTLLISMPLLLGHAVFPSFLPNLLQGAIVIQSQFRGGFIRQVPSELDAGLLQSVIAHYKGIAFLMPFQLALFIPPLLTALALAGITLLVYAHRKRFTNRWLLASAILGMSAVIGILAAGGWSYTEMFGFRYPTNVWILPLVFFFLIAVMGLKFGRLFPIWLLVAGIPFLVLYIRQDTHIWPASIPWIVMIMLWIDYLIAGLRRWASSAQHWRVLARSAALGCVVVLSVAFVDQLLNVASVRSVWYDIGASTREMGEKLMTAPKGSMVVTNLYRAVNIEYFAHSRVKHYLSNYWKDYPIPGRVVSERSDFEKVTREHFPEKDIYLLLDSQWPDRYLDDPPGTWELEDEFNINSRYYFLDPLNNLAPQLLWKNVSSPELLYSFKWRGGPFYREYTQNYSLYKLTSFSPGAFGGK